jgi:ribosomal protein S18 acetylase RimI-like enzyme
MNKVSLSSLTENILDEIVASFKEIGWNKPKTTYEHYLEDQAQNSRSIFVVTVENKFAGYVTLKWISDYKHFKEDKIPEISDLNVLPKYRKQGIGTILIKACENIARERGYHKIGLGVGLAIDYGSAQRLYVKLGYIPDGRGIHYHYQPVGYFQNVKVDDDLVLFLEKIF